MGSTGSACMAYASIVFFFFLTGIFYRRRQIHRRSLLPRGTLGWPFIGETPEFIFDAYSSRPEYFMDKRRLLYGKVFKSHILGSPTIISTDAEVSKAVLQSDGKTFVSSYPRSLTELMGKSSVLLINGSLHKRVHGLIGSFLKSPQLKAQITQEIQKYVQVTMDHWKDDQLVYIQDEAKYIAFRVLLKALMSLDEGEEMQFLHQQYHEFIAGLISLPIKLPGTTLYRSLQAKKRMVKLVHKIIQERRKNWNQTQQSIPKDVLDVFLTDENDQLTIDLISDNMIDLMIPGEDSVPILMTLAIKYLTDHPLALQLLLEENMKLKISKAQQMQQLLWTDYMSLPFTEIMVIPFHGQGHILPCIELCNHLAHRDFKITLLLPSDLSSSISTLDHHPLVQIADISFSPRPPSPVPPLEKPAEKDHHLLADPLSQLISQRIAASNPPVCLIVDVMMGWMLDTCQKSGIPIVSFSTSGSCSAAMEYAVYKLQPENLKPGETLSVPGLPESMRLTSTDLTHNGPPPPPHPHHPGGGAHHPPTPPHRHSRGPPPPPHHQGPGNQHPRPPGWISETEGSIALLMNTCSDLEGPFLDYVSKGINKPVWGVGPLLPSKFWKSVDSLVHDSEVRAKKVSNVTEEEVQQWLDSKPRGSVIYVAFGSEVGPNAEELAVLANGLEESNWPFIWVLQPGGGRNGPPGPPPGHHAGDGDAGPPPESDTGGYFPDGLESRLEGRGLIIRGWAPQLLILSHPSTAGFLSHCGWNSILEALGRGVPLLAWPIRGDQQYNAKLVASHLKVGLMLRPGEGTVTKSEIVEGIEKLIGDGEMKKRAGSIRSIFADGFPASSSSSLDAFRDFALRIGK